MVFSQREEETTYDRPQVNLELKRLSVDEFKELTPRLKSFRQAGGSKYDKLLKEIIESEMGSMFHIERANSEIDVQKLAGSLHGILSARRKIEPTNTALRFRLNVHTFRDNSGWVLVKNEQKDTHIRQNRRSRREEE